MVIKLLRMQELLQQPFESSVISYGNQTKYKYRLGMVWFESSVISYGNQTSITFDKRCFSV